MNNKILILVLVAIFSLSNVFAENHDTSEKDILEKAKEINKKIKKKITKQKKTEEKKIIKRKKADNDIKIETSMKEEDRKSVV